MVYKILATHIECISATEFRCTVAIDAERGAWKAYEKMVADYSDWDTVQEVARVGQKLSVAGAEKLFPGTGDRFDRYGG